MHFVLFTHSLQSCWNHGNAHFLRGVLRELLARGHTVSSYEPENGWSRMNLLRDHGQAVLGQFASAFPDLAPHAHFLQPDVEAMLDGADVVLMHEWSDPALIAAVGRRRRAGGRFVLLFHDTHHRAISDPDVIGSLDLSDYDAVLAFGAVLANIYRQHGWGSRAFIWHEAADTRLFRPAPCEVPRAGVVWVGNWGDDERSEELRSYLINPAAELGLALDVYGVRYPDDAIQALRGARYHGWLPNARAPEIFARHTMTVHVPRRYYADRLPGIPTIRMFEAMACGIPLLCAPWSDSEALFRPWQDYLPARSPSEMRQHMRAIQADAALRHSLAAHGLQTIEDRHTCRHRVDKLLAIIAALNTDSRPPLPLREGDVGRGPPCRDATTLRDGTPKTAAA